MFSTSRTPGQLRRIVTGFNAEGKSVIESDQMLEPQRMAPDGSSFSSTIWTTDSSPANVLDPVDGATRPLQGMGIRSPNGTILKYHEMLGGASPMHLTKSVDYAIVMEGEMEMHLDNGSCTVLRQGDIVIQRGTNHKWVKVKDGKAVKILICLIDGGEFVIPGSGTAVKDEIFSKM